ncbi:MAG: FKBP-type peptidyl-prolyl cis-trans isomerase [Novosphingobium sp.]|nr:FKBP-type peptidyl-prolyl cis-trans isomerase [Novosphingobium sp.]
MTEITRMPLQPIAKGSLLRLWTGIAALVLAAGGFAWAALPPMVKVETITRGEGKSPTSEDVALVNYKGTLADGTVFDEGKQAVFPLSEVVPGFTKALQQMQKGGKYRVEIPSELAYGDQQVGAIPANADLTFEIELLDFRSRAEIEQQQRLIQQLQQMQAQQGGAPHGAMPSGNSPHP